jgi:hypothetical protein
MYAATNRVVNDAFAARVMYEKVPSKVESADQIAPRNSPDNDECDRHIERA